MQANLLAVEMCKSRNPLTDAPGCSDFIYYWLRTAKGPSSGVKIRHFLGHLRSVLNKYKNRPTYLSLSIGLRAVLGKGYC